MNNAWLLNGVTADTNGTGVHPVSGPMTLWIWSTDFDSGTVTIQASPDGGTTWITLTVDGSAAAFTANTVRVIEGLEGGQLRATLTGSTAPDPVYVRVS
jgi:hypothetical protein